MTGVGWLRGVICHNSQLSVRAPQAVSVSRAVGFNRTKLIQFFSIYKSLLEEHNFSASQLWNMDKTRTTNAH